jgi:hypothetical protein
MIHKNPDSHCKGQNKRGEPCGAAATAGGLCYFHANPNRASELGRIGGQNKRDAAAEREDPLPKLDTVTAVRDTVNRLIEDVYAGRLAPRVASSLGPLINLQLRAIEATDLERRIAKLEKKMFAEVNNGLGEQQTIPPSDLSDHAYHSAPEEISSGNGIVQTNTSGRPASAFDPMP